MRYFKTYEGFKKDYMKKIDLKDFKKIKKGTKLMYMGGKVEVLDNNGYVLKLKGEDGRTFTVNKSQFDHGGMTMRESINELRTSPVSGTKAGFTTSLEDRKYELKKDAKGAIIGNFSNVTLPKGTIIYNLPGGVFADHFSLKNKYSSRSSQGPQYFDKPTFKGIMIKQTPALLSYIEKNSKVLESFDTEIIEAAQIPSNIKDFAKRKGRLSDVKQIARWAEKAGLGIRGGTAIGKGYDTLVLDLTYNGAEIYFDLDTGKIKVNRQPVTDWKTFSKAVNESSERDGTEASDGKHKHTDHLEEDIEAMWKKAYGEKFATKYPGVAKIIRQRKIRDPREIARIWKETYGENFKEEYPAMWDMLSK